MKNNNIQSPNKPYPVDIKNLMKELKKMTPGERRKRGFDGRIFASTMTNDN